MLGLAGATALVAGGMIGAGILILPAMMAQFGSWSILGWFLASFMAYSIAIVFGRLSSVFKGGKGPVDYVARVFGDNSAYMVGWGYFIAISASSAAVASALGGYAKPLIGFAYLPDWTLGFMFLISLLALNIISSASSGGFLVVLTFVKIIFFSIFGILGLMHIGNYELVFGGINDLIKSASMAMFAFLGVEFASLSSGNIKDPEKNVMLSTKYGVMIASLVFLLVHCAVLFVLKDPSLTNRPVYEAAISMLGHSGAVLIAVIAFISCLSTINGMVIVEANMIKTIADEGWFRKSLGAVTKGGFPWIGGLIFVCTSLFFMFDDGIRGYVVLVANSLVGIVYIMSCLVDMKKVGLDQYNIVALLSSSLLLYNCNLYLFLSIAFIYVIGYFLKKVLQEKK